MFNKMTLSEQEEVIFLCTGRSVSEENKSDRVVLGIHHHKLEKYYFLCHEVAL